MSKLPIFELFISVGNLNSQVKTQVVFHAKTRAKKSSIESEPRVAIQLAKIWLEFWLEKRLEIPF